MAHCALGLNFCVLFVHICMLFFSLSLNFGPLLMFFDIMDGRKRALLVLALYWCFYMLIQHVLSMQALILGFELQNSALVVTLCGLWNRKERAVWSIDRQEGFPPKKSSQKQQRIKQ